MERRSDSDTVQSSADGVIRRSRQILSDHYGSRLAGVLLYGSVARGQAEPGSDLDLLVLLREPFDYFHELRTLVDALSPVQLDSPWLISARPAAVEDLERGSAALYRNARAEGIAV